MKAKWPTVSFAEVLQPVRRTQRLAADRLYNTVGVKWYAEGLFRRDPLLGRDIKAKQLYRVAAGDLVYNRLFAWKGSFALAGEDHDGCYVSGEFPCFTIDRAKAHPKFLRWFTATPSFWQSVVDLSTGSSRQSRLRLKEERFLAMTLPLPPMDVQERVVDRVESSALRLSEARSLRESVETERDEMLRAFARELAKDAPRRPMQEVAPIVRRPVEIDKTAEYPELGIRSFGRGTFHKPAVAGATLGSKRLYRIEPGDLLFSNVFSWEGAIAVVRDADAGRFGSHRFITCVPNPSLATAEFLRCWLLTAEGMAHILEASPGAAGRNRTLGLKKLMAIPVPVPPLDAQQKLSDLSHKVSAARQVQDTVADEMKNLMPALLDRAFSGTL